MIKNIKHKETGLLFNARYRQSIAPWYNKNVMYSQHCVDYNIQHSKNKGLFFK